ncbi:hypothetical protein NDU88_006670 [Pleurodeles waltl]|uniref:Uncharacterized protein n=1 Tax=Pleurodeles waltl TaxID=8319 RepID=A0AAV7PLQ2_PLEWA|nr:hypothetical protein NDU88_006670 [Pleurodeles waltl]
MQLAQSISNGPLMGLHRPILLQGDKKAQHWPGRGNRICLFYPASMGDGICLFSPCSSIQLDRAGSSVRPCMMVPRSLCLWGFWVQVGPANRAGEERQLGASNAHGPWTSVVSVCPGPAQAVGLRASLLPLKSGRAQAVSPSSTGRGSGVSEPSRSLSETRAQMTCLTGSQGGFLQARFILHCASATLGKGTAGSPRVFRPQWASAAGPMPPMATRESGPEGQPPGRTLEEQTGPMRRNEG